MYNWPLMWQHNYEPVGGSLVVSALVAAIPIFVLFSMLGVLRKPTWMAASSALASALVVALAAYGMPVKLAVMSMIFGAAFGIFPISWICFGSILLYRLAVDTGKFEIIKDSVGGLTNDRRLQAMFVAFSFGAFIEGAAGFGAPVAVSGAMLAGLGFSPFYAAGICLLGNTTPVAFGSLGIPVTTLANITGLPVLSLSAMIGRLCAMVSLFIPGYLIVVMSGPRRALEVLPAIIACGVSFASVQFYVSNYWGPELTDIASSLTCIGVMVLVLKIWKPARILRLEGDLPITAEVRQHSRAALLAAWLPYMMLVVCVLVFGAPTIKAEMNRWTDGLWPTFLPKSSTVLNGLLVPGLHNAITRIPPVTAKPSPYAAVYEVNWLSAAGTACLAAAALTALILRVSPRLQVRDALHRQIPRLLDEVVLDAADLRRREHLRPVDRVLADRQSTAAAPAARRRRRALARRLPRRFLRRGLDGQHARARRLHALRGVDPLHVRRDEAARDDS